MTALLEARVSRQSTILALTAVAHAGAIAWLAGGLLPRLIEAPPQPPVQFVLPRAEKPVARLRPDLPALHDFVPSAEPPPVVEIPQVVQAAGPYDASLQPGRTIARNTLAATGQPMTEPTLLMHDDRLSALTDACYPAAARRRGEEGRALTRIVIDARGQVADWSKLQGTGFPRLDAALDCVIRRLRFNPGRRDGVATAAEVRLPIAFRLD